jgi:hypothetical protein
MLADRLALGISLPFCLGIAMREKLFLAGFLGFSLKQSLFQRMMVCQIGFVLL